MRKLLTFILVFISLSAFGQLDTVDLRAAYFGVPSIEGQADFVKNEAYKINHGIRHLDTLLAPPHVFMYFNDSAVSKSYTTAWAHLTNATDSIFIPEELIGASVVNDTIILDYAGDYNFYGSFTHDGDNLETVSIRFYNSTQSDIIHAPGSNTMRAANNYMSTSVIGYGEIVAGDSVIVQYKGDANGTSKFQSGVINIIRLHGE